MIAPIPVMPEMQWLELFIPQLAAVANRHDLDTRTDEGYAETVNILIELSKMN
jgi:hypothetical protein